MFRRVVYSLLLFALGCSQADVPDLWHDEKTACEFVGGQPCDAHYAMWVDVYETAQALWSQTPSPIRVTIIEAPSDLIYVDGEWQTWQIGRLGFAVIGGKAPQIFIAGFFPDETIPLAMAHELVHVVWGIRDHSDIFWEHNEDLLMAM
jgi:hypothetical protein